MILTVELKFPVLQLTTYKALLRWFQSNVSKPKAKYLQKQINQSAHSKQVHAFEDSFVNHFISEIDILNKDYYYYY